MEEIIKPRHLKKGDMVGLVSSSAPFAGLVPHRVKAGVKMLKSMGFEVKIGRNAMKVTNHTAGLPKERANDINGFFKDKSIKAIISFIGGNHSNQILEYLDFEAIKNNPKVFVGYSDTTVLHLAIFARTGLVTFYGPAVLTQFAENPRLFPYTEEYFKRAVMNRDSIGEVTPSKEWTDEVLDWFKKGDLKRSRKMEKNSGWKWLRCGKTTGAILGGCVSSLMHLRGTSYWPDFSEKILFLETSESSEDFAKGERLEEVDAHLTDLGLSGIFKKIKGMIVGRPFGYNKKQIFRLKEIIKERTEVYKFPILYGVDVGHSDPMITIPLGVQVVIDSHRNNFEFVEKGTI